MICVARQYLEDFFPHLKKRRIRLDRRVPMILITGHHRERIDAVIGKDNRIKHLVVFTRTSRVGLSSRR